MDREMEREMRQELENSPVHKSMVEAFGLGLDDEAAVKYVMSRSKELMAEEDNANCRMVGGKKYRFITNSDSRDRDLFEEAIKVVKIDAFVCDSAFGCSDGISLWVYYEFGNLGRFWEIVESLEKKLNKKVVN